MKSIISQFRLANPVADPKPLKVGLINESYILPAAEAGGESYFLQRINHLIFTNVEGLQNNIQVVTDHIREKLTAAKAKNIKNRVLQLVPTIDGKLYYQDTDGKYWRVYVLIENGTSEERVTPHSAYLAGRAFGQFQSQLSDLGENDLVESIPNFHNMEFRLQQLHDAIRDDKAGRVASCQDIIADLLRREEEMCKAERLHREGLLPKRVNHCDTKVNNMLFDAAGRPLCIVDLDTVMPGYVLSDYGDFMRTAANTGAEDDPNLDNIHVDMEVFTAYTRGYLEEATFLTDLERSLLPFGVRLLSYMQAVRFFADYLNGDTYYRIQYPEHNLVRTRAQIRLLEEQEKMTPLMDAVVAACAAGKMVDVLPPNGGHAILHVDKLNWPDAFPENPWVAVTVSRDAEALHLHYDVDGLDLRAVVDKDFGPVWTDSCCEFFCRVPGKATYTNFEINCIGRMIAASRLGRDEQVQMLTPDEMARIKRFAPMGSEPFDLREGEQHWQVGMTIPFSLILGMTDAEWRAIGCPVPLWLECNFYKCGDETPHPHFLSWSPIPTPAPDFHRPEHFGLLVL